MMAGPMFPGAAGAKPPMGGAAAGGAAPKVPLPGSISGGPSGPGGSPVTPIGAGAGNEAQADAIVKMVMPALHKVLAAYPIGAPKYNAVINAIRSLTKNFGKEQTQSLVPSAILQMAQMGKSGMGGPSGPPPPIQPAPQAPIPGAGGGAGPAGAAPPLSEEAV